MGFFVWAHGLFLALCADSALMLENAASLFGSGSAVVGTCGLCSGVPHVSKRTEV
jgi:hypothetical protein